MSPIKSSILFLCLILIDRAAMIVTISSAVQKPLCRYNKSASNVRFSKLVMDGQSVEIEGTSYHCSNGSMREIPRQDVTTDIKFGETSVAEHHISKRFLGILIGIGIGCALLRCLDQQRGENPPPPPPPPPLDIKCPVSGQVIYAQRVETKAVHSWPEPTATGGDNRNPIKLTTEKKSGSYFERGSHTVTYEVSDRRGHVDGCSYTFVVKVISCLPIQPSSNSKVTCDGEFIYGSACTVKCNEGYEMTLATNNNEQVISCEKNGTTGVHSESPNTCKAIKCPHNDSAIRPANGVAVCSSSNYEFQTVCIVNCNSGYTTIGGPSVACQSNKQWSNTLAGCEDSEKPTINGCPADIYTNAERNDQPVIISWSVPTAIDNSGTATVTQTEGLPPGSSISLGHHKIVYTASDAKGNASPNCTFYVHVTGLTCIPPQISDRYITYDCADGYGYGSSCKLSCMGSFPLMGNDTITCERISNASMESTYWDVGSTAPYCKTNPCNPLPPPVNGAISCAAWLYGQMCQMQCQEKFDIPFGTKSDDGVSDFKGQFVCSQTTGRYMPSNTVPNCTEVRDIRFSSLPGEYFYYVGDCNDEETLKQIKQNFISVMMQLEDDGFDGVCPNTTECNVNNTEVTCGPTSGRRKRSADDTDSDLYLLPKRDYKRSASEIRVSFSVMTSWGNSNPSMDTFLHLEKVQQNVFDSIKESAKSGNFNVNGLSPDIDSFSYGWSDPHCPEGTTIRWRTMTCVPCPVGTYLDKSNPSIPKCRNCPKGTFKDNEDDALCTPCSSGMSTSTDGAETLSECKEKCDRGEFSNNGLKPCNVCPRSRYQSKEMSTSCEECPHGKTSNPGSSSVGNCSEFDIVFSKPGDAIVFENSQNDETKSLTISTWIKNYNSSLTLLQGYSSSLNITYGDHIDIEMFGSKTTINITTDVHNWHHIAIALNGDTATTSVYINGKLDVQENIRTLANVSLIAPNSKFAVTLNEDSSKDISITGYQIISHIPSKDEIEALSSSCQYTSNDTIVSASKIDWTYLQNPQMIVPSQCDNIDQCSPNPCNGHRCTDGVGSYSCHCNNGFSGENCNISPNYCRDTPCRNGGTCQNRNDTYTCMCSLMYKGRNCEIPKVNGGWSVWSEFSECSASCNGGVKTRSRVCNNPAPDPDGLPCDLSKSTEMLPCNSETCPSCPTLRRSFGNILNCSDVNEDEVCTVSCQSGYAFVPDNLPLEEYKCGRSTGYTWNGQTPACGRADMPRRLSTVSTIEYNPAIPCDKTSTALNSVQSKLEATLSCYQHAICAVTTTSGECSSSRRRKRSTSSVEITLTATLSEQNLDLESYYTNGSLSDSLRTLVNTVVEIENSTRILNDTDGILNFDMDGTTFSPAGMQVTGIVDCDNGQGSDGPVCIDCPMGTYSTSGNCNLCAKGTYQDEIGQVVCKSCPTGLTTKYIGSQDASSCTELVDSIQNNTQQTPASRETEINVIVIVGVSVSLGVLLILLTGIFFWYYHTKCSTRQRRSKSRLSLGSFLSLRKVAPEVDDIKVNDYIIMPPVQHKPVFDVKAL